MRFCAILSKWLSLGAGLIHSSHIRDLGICLISFWALIEEIYSKGKPQRCRYPLPDLHRVEAAVARRQWTSVLIRGLLLQATLENHSIASTNRWVIILASLSLSVFHIKTCTAIQSEFTKTSLCRGQNSTINPDMET